MSSQCFWCWTLKYIQETIITSCIYILNVFDVESQQHAHAVPYMIIIIKSAVADKMLSV